MSQSVRSFRQGLRRGRGSRSNSPFGDEDAPNPYHDYGLNDNINVRINNSKRTAFGYDDQMLLHYNLWDPFYFERPERTKACYDYITSLGLLNNCLRIEAKSVDENQLLLVHQPEHINLVKSTEHMTESQLKALSTEHDCVYFNNYTNACANLATGTTIEVLKSILENRAKNGFCLIRPPGHHAMSSDAAGFCIYNNVAIAANYALSNHLAQKILIVDWDVHHGQATQYQFYNTSKVLYISIHRYENATFYPTLRESNYDFIGSEDGKGFNINLPLNKTHLTNSDYLALFYRIILPVAYEFNPDLVLVSAGFDSVLGCPEGQMDVHPACFAHMTNKLMDLANGKLLVVLEGGYCIESLKDCVALTLATLKGLPPPQLESSSQPHESVKETIRNCLKFLQFYWKSLSINSFENQEPYPEDIQFLSSNSWNAVKVSFFPIEPNPLKNQIDVAIIQKIEQLRSKYSFVTFPNKTCFVHDCRMENHMNERSHHPESPRRTQIIFESLRDSGISSRCKQLESRFATKEELSFVHTLSYIEDIENVCKEDSSTYHRYSETLNSIYINQHSYFSALLSCGSLLNIVDEVCSGRSQNGFAIIRPPGHHAESHCAMGFCFFNNVAVAATYAIDKYTDIKKILIVDWDVHHGNGTQHRFYSNKNVLYISLHRYDNGDFFPNSTDACPTMVGEGEGEGFNVNIAWNKKPVRDSEYLSAFVNVILPIGQEFNPDLVIISSGFDAARGDQLGGLAVTPECYGHLTQMLTNLANGRVILALEGGYNLNVISECMSHCVCSLLGYPTTKINFFPPNKIGIEAIRRTIASLMPYWNCLRKFETNTIYAPASSFKINLPVLSNELQASAEAEVEVVILAGALRQLSVVEVVNQAEQSVEDSLSQGNANIIISEPDIEHLETPTATVPDLATTSHTTHSLSPATPQLLSTVPHVDRASGANTLSSNIPTVIRDGTSVELSLRDLIQFTNVPSEEIHNFLGLSSTDVLPERIYAIEPRPWCPHLSQVQQSPSANDIDVHGQCSQCPSIRENWLCLTCYQVFCGRFVEGHMLQHFIDSRHPLVLSFSDLSSWCYECESYIHNEILSSAKREAHIAKFGIPQPTGSSSN